MGGMPRAGAPQDSAKDSGQSKELEPEFLSVMTSKVVLYLLFFIGVCASGRVFNECTRVGVLSTLQCAVEAFQVEKQLATMFPFSNYEVEVQAHLKCRALDECLQLHPECPTVFEATKNKCDVELMETQRFVKCTTELIAAASKVEDLFGCLIDVESSSSCNGLNKCMFKALPGDCFSFFTSLYAQIQLPALVSGNCTIDHSKLS